MRVATLVVGFMLLNLIPSTAFASAPTERGSKNRSSGFNSEYNHSKYWGENCKKFEEADGLSFWTASRSDVEKVIVKGGPKVEIYTEGPFENLTAAHNYRSGKPYTISHVIECYGDHDERDDEKCSCDDESRKDDPECQPEEPQPPVDEPKDPPQEEPQDEPQVDEETPEVLGDTTGKGGEEPEILAETGIGAIPTMFIGMIFAGTALTVHNLARDVRDEFEEIAL